MTNLPRGVEKHPGAPLEQVSLASCVLFARRRHAASAGCTSARSFPFVVMPRLRADACEAVALPTGPA